MVCNTGECMIPVEVVDCAITAPDIEVQGASRNLFWILDPHSSYKFASNGIAIANNDGEFSGPGLNGSRKQFHWFDANTKANPTPYKYTVTIEGCATPLDPSIVNRG